MWTWRRWLCRESHVSQWHDVIGRTRAVMLYFVIHATMWQSCLELAGASASTSPCLTKVTAQEATALLQHYLTPPTHAHACGHLRGHATPESLTRHLGFGSAHSKSHGRLALGSTSHGMKHLPAWTLDLQLCSTVDNVFYLKLFRVPKCCFKFYDFEFWNKIFLNKLGCWDGLYQSWVLPTFYNFVVQNFLISNSLESQICILISLILKFKILNFQAILNVYVVNIKVAVDDPIYTVIVDIWFEII